MNNIFIIGPVASGKNTLLDKIVSDNDVIALDTGRIFRYVAYELSNKLGNEIDFEKLLNNEETEIKKVTEKIYHLTRFIDNQLLQLEFKKNLIFKNNIEFDCEYLYSKQTNTILPIITKISTIRDKIIKFIDNNISNSKKPIIMTGHNIKEINTTKFTVVFLDVDEKESALRLYNRNPNSYNNVLEAYEEILKRNTIDKIKETKKILPFLYDYIYINTTQRSEKDIYEEFSKKIIINNEKNEHFIFTQNNAIDRDAFNWIFNPILEPIKSKLKELTNLITDSYPYINQNDLIYQTLILTSSHNIYELYPNCNHEYLRKVEKSIIDRDQYIHNEFIEKVNNGIINPNDEIILKDLITSTLFLLNLYSSKDIKEIMIKYNSKSSKSNLILHNGLMITDNESHNMQTIINFRKISPEMSKYISKYCHYLHTPRDDEFVAYGAFIDDDIYPFAYVSFSKQDRDYKKQLLFNLGIEPQNSLEMTRAWCSNSAPQNIMSSLFQYSINDIAKNWKEDSKLGKCDKNLQAISTAINPNLGFKASSFLGCNFIPIALRPAQFTFKSKNGIISYETRREIEKDSFNEQYFENKINILPLNELILCLDKNKINNIIKSKILLIDKKDYESILKNKILIKKEEK